MIVADASAIGEYLLLGPKFDAVAALLARGATVHAPHLLDLEVAHVLRRHVAVGELTEAEALSALSTFAQMPIRRHAHRPLLARVWELRHNLSAYDAVYVALAEALRATFVTLDRRLKNAPGTRVDIELL